jgi:radical SAM protein with 4Fe4S-binding SPASM domain
VDGCFDELVISLYDEKTRAAREKKLRAAFKKTKLVFTNGAHIPTHFSPMHSVVVLAQQNLEKPCNEPQRRMIVNHLGEMLLCCDDCIGNFNLGSIYRNSLKELWFSDKHQYLVRTLQKAGGRHVHSYCESCPRP